MQAKGADPASPICIDDEEVYIRRGVNGETCTDLLAKVHADLVNHGDNHSENPKQVIFQCLQKIVRTLNWSLFTKNTGVAF